MSRNKKPRKAYRPRPIVANPMALALHLAAKPTVADRTEVLDTLARAINALRKGWATEEHWAIAAGGVSVALAIEDQGIVRGLRGHFELAGKVLQDIYDRAKHTDDRHFQCGPLYFNELDALAELLNLHSYQVNQLGRAELLAAIGTAQRNTIAQGHTVSLAHDLRRMAA